MSATVDFVEAAIVIDDGPTSAVPEDVREDFLAALTAPNQSKVYRLLNASNALVKISNEGCGTIAQWAAAYGDNKLLALIEKIDATELFRRTPDVSIHPIIIAGHAGHGKTVDWLYRRSSELFDTIIMDNFNSDDCCIVFSCPNKFFTKAVASGANVQRIFQGFMARIARSESIFDASIYAPKLAHLFSLGADVHKYLKKKAFTPSQQRCVDEAFVIYRQTRSSHMSAARGRWPHTEKQ